MSGGSRLAAVPVTDEDIAHVQRAFDEFNVRFEDLRTDAGLGAYHQEFFTDDAVIDNVEHFPVPTTYQGFSGYRNWFDETLAAYTGIEWEVEQIAAIGERVHTIALIRGREPGDPTLIEVRLALNYSVRDGLITRVDVYLNAATAEAVASSTA
jgi:limonene-1,2-epoxide hydrolase